MNQATLLSIDLALHELRRRQLTGEECPPPGAATARTIERISTELGHPVSRRTFARYEQQLVMRLAKRMHIEAADAIALFRRIKP
ncbi:hypothetical protein OVA24_06360 [Luteolibacter sp. SL250]|uniref:hypothetical protein n=1 Tax=Luteolibacter sp. SL250 TaxID=2995170 RepID=UPI00226E9F8D|nr:hypothetical protein [Luteolibacter sp. SL250]WAC21004.1 hypothetical protein OVA24_06360 [Luteolibacter sp. SL250]